MKRKLSLLVMVIGIFCIGSGLVFNGGFNFDSKENKKEDNLKKEEKPLTKVDILKKYIKDNYINKNKSFDDINKNMSQKLFLNDVVIAKDGFLRAHLKAEDMNKYNLNNYLTVQNKYAEEVEKIFLDNLKYEAFEANDGNVTFNATGFNFALYATEVNSLAMKLMTLAGIKSDLMETNYSEFEIYNYKAKIVAMKILSSKLNDYLDSKSTEISLFYENDKLTEGQDYSLYSTLIRKNSEMFKTKSLEVEKHTATLLNEAVKNGTIDKTKALDL